MRVKLRLTETTETAGNTSKRIKFFTVYDPTIPEDLRFSKATPSGSAEFYIDNPAALEKLKLGQTYYVDFTEAEQ